MEKTEYKADNTVAQWIRLEKASQEIVKIGGELALMNAIELLPPTPKTITKWKPVKAEAHYRMLADFLENYATDLCIEGWVLR